ncbi:MAG: DMT family transporter, partial [Acidimicrobiia bacterium]|nr:DMT family transporter [Acidimicrobiia bacterium]
ELWLHGAFIGVPRIGLAPVLFIASLQYISAGVEAIIITTIPVVTALMAWVFLKEHQSRAQQAGFAVALAGSLLIILSGESGLGAGEGNPALGGLLALGGVFFASLSGVVARHYAPRHDTASLAVPMFITGGAFAFATAFVLRDFHPGDLDIPLWALLVALGLGSTLLPFAATLYAAKHTTAARTSLVAYVAPLISVIGGVLILDEVLTAPIIIGGSLALTGVVLAGSSARFPRRVGA